MSDPRIFEPCEHCGGEGIMYRQHPWHGGVEVPDGECPACNGEGVVEIEFQPIEMEDLDEISGDFDQEVPF
jgi:DnaJ-class molecular chaperone